MKNTLEVVVGLFKNQISTTESVALRYCDIVAAIQG